MFELLSKATPSLQGKLMFALAMCSLQLCVLCLTLTPSVAFESFVAWISVAVVFIATIGFKAKTGALENA